MPATILVVDENATTVATVTSALAEAGYSTVGAQSFHDAVRTLERTAPALLVASIRLGQYNGLHLLVRGRAEHPRLAAIVIGPPGSASALEARALGADVYLPQPLEIRTLLSRVADVLERSAGGERAETAAAANPACASA